MNDDAGCVESSLSTSSSTTSTSTTGTVLVVPDPGTTDTTPVTTLSATGGLPEEGEERLNEGGVPITLDETAALACANAEFARDSINLHRSRAPDLVSHR